jgi:glycosyltransferase involved in cell wall biosynthesis
MIIGIDAREIENGVFTGIGRVLENFLGYFARLDDEHRCILFSTNRPQLPECDRIRSVTCGAPSTMVWDQIVLPRLFRKHGIDLLFSPYYKVPLNLAVPVVSTIFDLMYIYYPFKWKKTGFFSRCYYRWIGGLMVGKAKAVFTCSEYSKSEILRFFRIEQQKVKVIHLGLSGQYKPLDNDDAVGAVKKKFGIMSPYILYTGNFKPHKNVARLVKAFEQIAKCNPALTLVLAGKKDDTYETLYREVLKNFSAGDKIVTTGFVSLEEQVALLNGAVVYVCPSLYEGFGYPPLEAMACGVPVVSSARTSLDEVIGNAALRCDPEDIEDMAEKIEKVYRDRELSLQLRERGLQQAGKFTSRRFCDTFYSFLLETGGAG